ncbi:hypothetical protein IT084_04205 [Desulfallas sp. Bu1-1]|uniref:hypothetical protein n=1 Tax=Desulfallas sp. Bu1-1 TaxID=2787620 RepID=UPI00189D47B9|nr:hypothetical protein [Desulfallas sp. Bu1-1]MBF7082178.1 hypothetical protein [Desulfallas sp. Bu1-1]
MAAQREAVLLTDDIRLRKKAYDIKLKTFTTPELLIYFLNYDEFAAVLNGLVKHKRLSENAAKMYLEIKKRWKKG